MSIEAVKDFYKATFDNAALQEDLIDLTDIDDFIKNAVEVGKKHGYIFTYNEMKSTMDGYGQSDTFKDVDFESEWVSKIVEMGWVPLGYSR